MRGLGGVVEAEVGPSFDLEPGGILVIRFPDGYRLDEAETRRAVARHVELAAGGQWPTLVDIRGLSAMSPAARYHVAGPEVAAVVTRLALLLRSPVSRMIANFFLRVGGPSYPVRFFEDEAAARAWLMPPVA